MRMVYKIQETGETTQCWWFCIILQCYNLKSCCIPSQETGKATQCCLLICYIVEFKMLLYIKVRKLERLHNAVNFVPNNYPASVVEQENLVKRNSRETVTWCGVPMGSLATEHACAWSETCWWHWLGSICKLVTQQLKAHFGGSLGQCSAGKDSLGQEDSKPFALER